MTAQLASVQGSACVWGFYSDQDWQRSLNGLAAYDAIDKLIGKPMSGTSPQLSWAIGNNADGSPAYQRLYTPRLDADRTRGRVSFLTWISFNLGHPEQNTLFNNESILAGKHDAYITQFAHDAAAYGHRFVVRFDPEMNGWWEGPFSEYDANNNPSGGNTDGSFARMWRYVVGKVRPIAPNILWYWCANPLSNSPNNPTYTGKLAHFYPGDDWVDFVGYDVYNKASDDGEPWLTFRECLEGRSSGYPANSLTPMLALAPGKPWLLGEVGCAPATAGDTTPGAGDRAAWIRDMFGLLRTRYPFIKGLQWYNPAPYGIDAAAAVGFSQAASDPSAPAAPLPDPESTSYALVSGLSADQTTIAQLQTQLQQAQSSLQGVQAQLQTVTGQLQQAQATDTTDQAQIAALQTQLSAANTAASTATQHAQACVAEMQSAQQHLGGLLSFAQAPLP